MMIYLTTNNIKGKIYIGKYCGTRSTYLGSGVYVTRAIKKYGKENFSRITLEDGITDHDYLCEREKYWIAFYDSTNPEIGYNLTEGGRGILGFEHSEETKKQISKNSATKSGIENPNFGTHRSEEIKAKISRTMHGTNMGKDNPMYNKCGKDHHNIMKEDIIIQIVNMLNENILQKDISKELNVGLNIIVKTKAGFYSNIYDLPEQKWITGFRKGADNPLYGKHRSSETIRKISESHKGKNSHCIIKKEIILEIIKLLDSGIFQKDICHVLGISIGTIRKVKIGFYNDIYDLPKRSWTNTSQTGINNSCIVKKYIILKIIDMLNEGYLQKDIVEKLNVNAKTVRKTREGWYNDIYDLPDKKWTKSTILKKEKVLKTIDLLNLGVSVAKIIESVGINKHTVYKIRDGFYNDIYDL